MDQIRDSWYAKCPKMTKNDEKKNNQNFKHFACFLEFHGMQDIQGRHRTTPLNIYHHIVIFSCVLCFEIFSLFDAECWWVLQKMLLRANMLFSSLPIIYLWDLVITDRRCVSSTENVKVCRENVHVFISYFACDRLSTVRSYVLQTL